jgi:hypothetical protein
MNPDVEMTIDTVQMSSKTKKCDGCERAFGNIERLNNHIIEMMFRRHSVRCNLCGFRSTQVSHMENHIAERHPYGGDDPYLPVSRHLRRELFIRMGGGRLRNLFKYDATTDTYTPAWLQSACGTSYTHSDTGKVVIKPISASRKQRRTLHVQPFDSARMQSRLIAYAAYLNACSSRIGQRGVVTSELFKYVANIPIIEALQLLYPTRAKTTLHGARVKAE